MALGDFLHLESDRSVATELSQAEYASVTGHGIEGGLAGELLVYTGSKLQGAETFGYASLPAGAVGAPSLIPSGDPNTGIWFSAADKVNISVGGLEAIEFGTGGIVINDGGANRDLRVEADADANAFFMDASQFNGQGSFAFGDPGGATSYILARPNISSGIGVNASYAALKVDPQLTTTPASSTNPIVASAWFEEPVITKGDVITTATTVYIRDAPTEGDTNNLALFVDAGLSRFDGDGTDVFELPADATDPTSGGGAATGRIPVKIGGSTVYLAYY
jgi:hypothetical protein